MGVFCLPFCFVHTGLTGLIYVTYLFKTSYYSLISGMSVRLILFFLISLSGVTNAQFDCSQSPGDRKFLREYFYEEFKYFQERK